MLQFKHRIFEPLGQFVCRRVVEANVYSFVWKQIGVFCSAYRRSVSRAGYVSGPYRRSMLSSRRICADSVVTSPPSARNEVLAFEISSPSTSAETVATTAMDTETRLFVSSVR